MSSTYYLLCASHDPATIITELGDPEALPRPSDLEKTHPNCDFVISRVSGAPVEFGCPGFGTCPCGGHGGINWIDADWLRLLVIAQDVKAARIRKIRERSGLRCWDDIRLRRLRHELEKEERNYRGV